MAASMDIGLCKILQQDSYSCVKIINSTKRISIPSSFSENIPVGIFEVLNSELKRYIKQLQGFLLAYENVQFVNQYGKVVSEQPCIQVDIRADFCVFQPLIGCSLRGVVNKVSDGNIGCLIHGWFNASVRRPQGGGDWLGSQLAVDQEIILTLHKLDISAKGVYLQGEIIEVLGNASTEAIKLALPISDIKPDIGWLNQRLQNLNEAQSEDETRPEGDDSQEEAAARHDSDETDFNVTAESIVTENGQPENGKGKKKRKKKKKKMVKNDKNNDEDSRTKRYDEVSKKKKKNKHKDRSKGCSNNSSEQSLNLDDSLSSVSSDRSKKKKHKNNGGLIHTQNITVTKKPSSSLKRKCSDSENSTPLMTHQIKNEKEKSANALGAETPTSALSLDTQVEDATLDWGVQSIFRESFQQVLQVQQLEMKEKKLKKKKKNGQNTTTDETIYISEGVVVKKEKEDDKDKGERKREKIEHTKIGRVKIEPL